MKFFVTIKATDDTQLNTFINAKTEKHAIQKASKLTEVYYLGEIEYIKAVYPDWLVLARMARLTASVDFVGAEGLNSKVGLKTTVKGILEIEGRNNQLINNVY